MLNNVYTITINILNLEVEVIRKNIKNIHLGVYPPIGKLRIAVPFNINDESIKLYIISKISWIRKQQKSFIQQSRLPKREFLYRESHYFLGRRYLLNLIEDNHIKANIFLKNKTYINMILSSKYTNNLEYKYKLMQTWYRTELKKIVVPLIDKWQKITGITINQVYVRQMKTKWGSCNINKKHIWLNLELAKKPVHCIEYIILHELVHILEKYHNNNFIYYMDKFMPQWQNYKRELNELIFK